jgi:hypothetical protein
MSRQARRSRFGFGLDSRRGGRPAEQEAGLQRQIAKQLLIGFFALQLSGKLGSGYGDESCFRALMRS